MAMKARKVQIIIPHKLKVNYQKNWKDFNKQLIRSSRKRKIWRVGDVILSVYSKILVKLTHQQIEIQKLKTELKNMINEKERFEKMCFDYSENIEILTIDKEVAEERAEALQHENDSLKEQIAEASINMVIQGNEDNIGNTTIMAILVILFFEADRQSSAETQSSSIHIKELKMQNEKLKEALIR